MLWFNDKKDHGFISTDDGERLYVGGSGFVRGQKPQGKCAGRAVSFTVASDDTGRRAEGVAFVADAAPRRARRRHGSRYL
jgi:cold shock CspA family protein